MEPVIQSLDELDDSQRLAIQALLFDQTDTSFQLATWNQSVGYVLDLVMLFGGVIVSAGIGLQQVADVQALGLENTVFWVLILLSLVVNGCTLLQQRFNYFEVAKIHDETFSEINRLAWNYVALCEEFEGEGKTHRSEYKTLVRGIVKIKDREYNLLRQARAKGRQAAPTGSTNGPAGVVSGVGSAGVAPTDALQRTAGALQRTADVALASATSVANGASRAIGETAGAINGLMASATAPSLESAFRRFLASQLADEAEGTEMSEGAEGRRQQNQSVSGLRPDQASTTAS